jgi:hypothetical protein
MATVKLIDDTSDHPTLDAFTQKRPPEWKHR